jgi:hypothetical protein
MKKGRKEERKKGRKEERKKGRKEERKKGRKEERCLRNDGDVEGSGEKT